MKMKEKADLIVYNAKVYRADEKFSVAEAFAVGGGKILSVGTSSEILKKFSSDSVIDVGGKPVYPGFIDAHSHFYGYGMGLQQVDLRGALSFDEVLSRLKAASGDFPTEWLVGRGWDQNLWGEKVFPDKGKLDQLFPRRPVVLIRVDGHVVLANEEAIRLTRIREKTSFTAGEVGNKDGKMTGIFSENASDFIRSRIPAPARETRISLLRQAQENCFSAGLTGVCDAGLDFDTIRFIDSLQQSGTLGIRINAMLSPTKENFSNYLEKGPYHTDYLNVRSVKLYADGSLGSRTALLKHPYSDDPGKSGISVTSPDQVREVCALALKHGYQVNTHAIGDSAVKMILNIYSEFLKGKNDLRWRIEHAQVVDPEDLPMFGKFSIIPSVQATHATSDMYWAGERLGKTRIRWAYAYNELMKQNGWIANGTDFPIEQVDPIHTFYAAVARKDLKGFPDGGFQNENALSRKDALKSITIWAAKSFFEEQTRGSLEPGKLADFVILDKDLLSIPETGIIQAKVLKTYVGGKKVYERK